MRILSTKNLYSEMEKGFNPDMLSQLLNPRDPAAALRQFIALGSRELVEPLLEKVDILKFGGDLLQAAAFHGKTDIVELLLSKGADCMNPPESVNDETYRKSPFILQAAISGNISTLDALLKRGGSLLDSGFITLSKKKKNHVVSNVVGCAAYHGKKKMLQEVLTRLGKDYLEVEALEEPDKHGPKLGTF